MNEKTNFCKSFGWKLPLKWDDLVGLYPLDNDRRALVELSTHCDKISTQGQYVSFHATIVSKTHGIIIGKLFQFKDYLNSRLRLDERPDFKENFKVIDHCGWQWYIAVPKDTTPLVKAIEDWIKAWK